ncbi:MAG: Mu transposase C-terminal domain-containing protein, partial [Pyrinomonadaceae bacterium]
MLPDGSLTRPWLTLWQDLRTGLIWGWHLDLTPSSNTIGLAYANGVQNFGAQPASNPDADFYSYLYTDQGRDYRCKQITGQTLEFRDHSYGKAALIEGGLNHLCTQRKVGLMDEMGLKHLMARGYNAREKFIERTHKDISEWEKNSFENEYCGRGIGHKPEQWQKSWHRHQKLLKKIGMNADWLSAESPFMPIDVYQGYLANWITEYNHAEHTRTVLGGATIVPVREYERLYTTRYEISEDTLAMLLMRAAKRKIGKDGVQFFQSNWHFLHEAMSEFKGQEIEIRYTDNDWDSIYAVLPNGNIVKAERLSSSGVLNPNKKTMGIVAKTRAYEQKIAREHLLIEQSNWRGETTEERVNALLVSPDDALPPEQEKIAVNARVPVIGRFDGRHSTTSKPTVSAEQIDGLNVIDGMFRSPEKRKPTRIKDEWED